MFRFPLADEALVPQVFWMPLRWSCYRICPQWRDLPHPSTWPLLRTALVQAQVDGRVWVPPLASGRGYSEGHPSSRSSEDWLRPLLELHQWFNCPHPSTPILPQPSEHLPSINHRHTRLSICSLLRLGLRGRVEPKVPAYLLASFSGEETRAEGARAAVLDAEVEGVFCWGLAEGDTWKEGALQTLHKKKAQSREFAIPGRCHWSPGVQTCSNPDGNPLWALKYKLPAWSCRRRSHLLS